MVSNIVLSTKEYNVVGKRPIRHDGYDKVTGKALYGADMNLPGMLHGKVLRSPHAHANILSIDTSKAEAHPEVLAVITSADFADAPDEARVIVAGPPTNLKHLSNNCLAGEKALYKGQAIAAVAAQSAHAAEEALALIDVEYEVLPAVTTVEEAIADGAPQLHANYKGNVASHSEMVLGDIEKGFEDADLVVEKTFRTKTVSSRLHRAAHRHGLVAGRRQNHHLVQLTGPLPDSRSYFRCSRHSALAHQGDPHGNRRWIRRQDHHLP